LKKIKVLDALKKNKDIAKEKLEQVKKENESELLLATNITRIIEIKFCDHWNKFKLDPKFIEKEFFKCCEQLDTVLVDEFKVRSEFKKICKPYQDEYQRLDKEYSRLKIELSVTRKPKTKRSEP
jgi:hypothetical protein